MDEPPLFDGALQLTVTAWLWATTLIPVGASGAVAGVMGAEEAEEALSPTALVAVTVKV
jgi:hypothetical protein